MIIDWNRLEFEILGLKLCFAKLSHVISYLCDLVNWGKLMLIFLKNFRVRDVAWTLANWFVFLRKSGEPCWDQLEFLSFYSASRRLRS